MGNLEHPELRSYWYPVAESAGLATDSVAVTLLGDAIVRLELPGGGGYGARPRAEEGHGQLG